MNRRRLVVGLALAGAVCVLAGCGLTAEQEARQVATQQAQLAALIDRADGWGAEILAQIPEPEIEAVTKNIGGPRLASDYYEEWPKYYTWNQFIDLYPDGPRTPTQLADDLEPWLEDQGWVRHKEREFPRGKSSFERDYGREGYLLELQVDTVAPPRAQTISFLIVTPETDPHEPAPPTPTPDL
ncbi:hypothetical protein [uncultured Leifsonia sp.]|uniref:hypothetical protein n=1 Tax=uncultured Leifsonia sp. TaxID=340359 RepID=UPI0028D4B832|nr:hypothetical protein [uncultured Leifsonia sp.]